MFELFSISMVQLMAYCGFIQSRRFKDPLTKEKEAEMLTLFVITGTYNVNKSLHWKKNNTWYQMHSMLLKFTAGGYDRLKNAYRQEESKTPM